MACWRGRLTGSVPSGWSALAVATTAARLRQLRDERGATDATSPAPASCSQRVELERAEAKLRLETAVEALRRELECEPDEAVASPCPELAAGYPRPGAGAGA